MVRVWRMLLGLCDRTVLERVEVDENAQTVVAHVRPKRPGKRRCGVCGRLSPHEDSGDGRRRWRGLDLGTVQVWLEADAPRVRCREHGRVVVAVPWARHGARQTRAFEDTAAGDPVLEDGGVGAAADRLAHRRRDRDTGGGRRRHADRLAGLRRIGVDEISCAPRGADVPCGDERAPPLVVAATG